MIGFIKVRFITLRTSVSIGIDAVRLMPVERLSYAVSNVHPALHATRHALISKESDATC